MILTYTVGRKKMVNKARITNNYYPSIARVFSPIVMDSLISKGISKYLSEVLQNSGIIYKINKNIKLRCPAPKKGTTL